MRSIASGRLPEIVDTMSSMNRHLWQSSEKVEGVLLLHNCKDAFPCIILEFEYCWRSISLSFSKNRIYFRAYIFSLESCRSAINSRNDRSASRYSTISFMIKLYWPRLSCRVEYFNTNLFSVMRSCKSFSHENLKNKCKGLLKIMRICQNFFGFFLFLCTLSP